MSAKRWLNGTTSRNAKRTWTPGSATRNSPSSSWRLRSSRSFSLSCPPLSLLCALASMPREARPVRRSMLRRTGLRYYFELDPPDFDPPERDRVEPAFASVEPARDALEREEPDFVRLEPDFASVA